MLLKFVLEVFFATEMVFQNDSYLPCALPLTGSIQGQRGAYLFWDSMYGNCLLKASGCREGCLNPFLSFVPFSPSALDGACRRPRERRIGFSFVPLGRAWLEQLPRQQWMFRIGSIGLFGMSCNLCPIFFGSDPLYCETDPCVALNAVGRGTPALQILWETGMAAQKLPGKWEEIVEGFLLWKKVCLWLWLMPSF